MLRPGQVIKTGDQLYRVDYVNQCRARIVPLAKRHVTLADGREFDAERGGVNISPNSLVEIVEDLELARAQIELREAEREVAAAEREAVKREVKPAARVVQHTKGGGWYVVPGKTTSFKEGSLADTVMAFIMVNPGLDTKAIVAGCPAQGAVAACVSRFHQAGLIKKG